MLSEVEAQSKLADASEPERQGSEGAMSDSDEALVDGIDALAELLCLEEFHLPADEIADFMLAAGHATEAVAGALEPVGPVVSTRRALCWNHASLGVLPGEKGRRRFVVRLGRRGGARG